jgi:hypothetical protein
MASLVALSSVRGGKSRLPGNLAADDAEGADKGYPVRIEIGLVGRLSHDAPYPVMGEEEAPDFLFDQFRLSGAEDHALSALVDLEFVEHEFSQPPLMPLKEKSSLAHPGHPGRY